MQQHELSAMNATAHELRTMEKLMREAAQLYEQVASGEKSTALLKTANEHIRIARRILGGIK